LDDDDDDKVGRRDLQVVFPRHQKARTGPPGFGMFLRSQGKVFARIDSPQGLAVSLAAPVGRCIERQGGNAGLVDVVKVPEDQRPQCSFLIQAGMCVAEKESDISGVNKQCEWVRRWGSMLLPRSLRAFHDGAPRPCESTSVL